MFLSFKNRVLHQFKILELKSFFSKKDLMSVISDRIFLGFFLVLLLLLLFYHKIKVKYFLFINMYLPSWQIHI